MLIVYMVQMRLAHQYRHQRNLRFFEIEQSFHYFSNF